MKLSKDDIKKLKNNTTIWYLLDSQMKMFFFLVDKIRDVQILTLNGWTETSSSHFIKDNTYRLRPDYQEEEQIEIEEETPDADIQVQIKNINKRVGHLELTRGSLSKTTVKDIMKRISKLQKEVNLVMDKVSCITPMHKGSEKNGNM